MKCELIIRFIYTINQITIIMIEFITFWGFAVCVMYLMAHHNDYVECKQKLNNCGDVCDCESNDLLCAYECLQCMDKKRIDCCDYTFPKKYVSRY